MTNKEKFKVGVIGATGMVGQRFVTLLENHPWFRLTAVAASAKSAGKTYWEAVGSRWSLDIPCPEEAKDIRVLDAEADAEKLAASVDFCFCAVDMKKEEIRALEERYAKLECPIVSNNSAHRWTDDVPMVVPEINADHIAIIDAQRRRLGTKRGFIAVKSNCSLQSYVPALHPLMKYGLDRALVCTYQAISGAGKTFATWPEMVDNVIPYIGGEEEKSELEPLKLWGHIEGDKIVKAQGPSITAQCFRVACQDGHMAAVFMKFKDGHTPSMEQIKADWAAFRGPAQELELPSAPSSSCTILRKKTVRRPDWTVIWSTAWPYPSGACGLTRSMTINLSASLTTRCAALPAERYCWLSFSVQNVIFKSCKGKELYSYKSGCQGVDIRFL